MSGNINYSAYVEVVNTGIDRVFTNANENDVVFYAPNSNQSMHFGILSNVQGPSVIKMTPSNVSITGDIICNRRLNLSGLKVGKRQDFGSDANLTSIVNNVKHVSSYQDELAFVQTTSHKQFRFVSSNLSGMTSVATLCNNGQFILNSSNDTNQNPSYTWNGDSTTGMYHPNKSQLAFCCNGSNIMTLSNNVVTIGQSLDNPGYISAANIGMFRNRIINGDMKIDQRGGGVQGIGALNDAYQTYNIQPSSYYTIDRFACSSPGLNFGGLCVKQINLPVSDVNSMISSNTIFKTAAQISVLPNDSLIAYYPFNGSLTDISGNNVSLSLSGSGTPSISYPTACVYGTNSLYLANDNNGTATTTPANVLYNNSIVLPTTYTIAFWMCPVLTSAQILFLNQAVASGVPDTGSVYLQILSATQIECGFYNGVKGSITTTITAGNWYHVAMIYSQIAYNQVSLEIYLNGGINQNQGSYLKIISSAFERNVKGFTIGNFTLTTGSFSFTGLLDEFRMYGRALSGSEIAALANTSVSVIPKALSTLLYVPVVRLSFDNNITNLGSYANNVTIVSNVAMTYSPYCVNGTASYDLTGNSYGAANSIATRYITCTNVNGMAAYSMPITLSCWVNFSTITAASYCCILNLSTATQVTMQIVLYNNNFIAEVYTDSLSFQIKYSAQTPYVYKWYHLCATCATNDYFNFYVNGALCGSIKIGNLNLRSSTNAVRISSHVLNGQMVAGYIDDVRVYNRYFSSEDVRSLFTESNYPSYCIFKQVIEGYNVADLYWGTALAQPVSISMWIKNNTLQAQSLPISLNNSINLMSHFTFENTYADSMNGLRNITATGSPPFSSSIYKVGTASLNLTANPAGGTATQYINACLNWQIAMPVTICCWIYLPVITLAAGKFHNIFVYGTPGGYTINLCTNATGNLYADCRLSTQNPVNIAGTGTDYPLKINTWYHVAIVVTPGMEFSLFVNGYVVKKTYIPKNTPFENVNYFRIGSHFDNTFAFSGYLDDLRVYNNALTEKQLYTIYLNNISSTTPSQYLFPVSYVYNTPSIPSGSWKKISFTVPGETNAIWQDDNNGAITLALCFGSTALYNTDSANTWVNGLDYTVSNTQLFSSSETNFLTNINNSIYLTGMQLERGYIATPFEFRPYGVELQLCQRYFEKSYRDTEALGTYTGINSGIRKFAYNSTDFYDMGAILFKVSKRSNFGIPQLYSITGLRNTVYNLFNNTEYSASLRNYLGGNWNTYTNNYSFFLALEGIMVQFHTYAFHFAAEYEIL